MWLKNQLPSFYFIGQQFGFIECILRHVEFFRVWFGHDEDNQKSEEDQEMPIDEREKQLMRNTERLKEWESNLKAERREVKSGWSQLGVECENHARETERTEAEAKELVERNEEVLAQLGTRTQLKKENQKLKDTLQAMEASWGKDINRGSSELADVAQTHSKDVPQIPQAQVDGGKHLESRRRLRHENRKLKEEVKRLEAAFQRGNDLHDGQDDFLQNEELRSMILCHRQQYGREQQVHSASAEHEATVDGDSLSQLIRLLMDDHRGVETERQAAEDRKTTLRTEHEPLRRQIVQVES